MKTRIIAALAATLAASPVAAADLSYGNSYGYAPAAAAPASWTGFYVGGNIGYGWGSAGADSPKGFLGRPAGRLQSSDGRIAHRARSRDRLRLGRHERWQLQPGLYRHGAGPRGLRLRPRPHLRHAGFAYGKGSYQVFGLSNSQTSYGRALGPVRNMQSTAIGARVQNICTSI